MTRRSIIRNLVAAALGLSATLAAQTVTTVISNGSTNTRYDMVILGDGYQASEQNRFDQDVMTFLTDLFQTEPYQTFSDYYNVHTVFRASVDSGADHPDANPPIYRNTVYDASYNTGGTPRCLYIGNSTQALADAALAPASEGRVLVMVNDSRYGGCAGTFAVSYNGGQMAQVQIHEIGHSLGQLADEYDYPNSTYTGPEPSSVNITTSPIGQKWTHWHGYNGVSAFEGAGYHQYGLYRPRSNCLMRSLGQVLCAVCQENIARLTNAVCNAISQFSPASTNLTLLVGQTQTFSFAHFVPANHAPTIEWRLDGTVIPGQTGASYTLDTTGMSIGVHTLDCSVHDHSPLVRQDPALTMRHLNSWTLTVTDPNVSQLWFSQFQPSSYFATPGSDLTFSVTVENNGPAAAGPFDVEFFLATPGQWTTNDIYLGKNTIANLQASQQAVFNHQVSLPWRLEPVLYYVHAILDRTNAVPEVVETDNHRMTGFLCQPGPCVTRLEFADPLLYPFDAASVSTSAGGSVHPTVVAPCATPGTMYLIVWGGSGTSPGTPLAPGLTIPINQDFYTEIGLAATNGPWFQSFLGTLDANGLGNATFALPAGTGLWPSSGHFAALLIDPQTGFSDVSNPVAITIDP